MPTMTDLNTALDRQKALKKQLSERLNNTDLFAANATYDKPFTPKTYLKQDIVKATIWAIASGERFLFIGPPGIGKTSFMKSVTDMLDYELVYIPAAMISIENLMAGMPVDDEHLGQKVLEFLVYDKFASDKPKVIVIDEIGRADPSLGNTLMELLQEGTLAGDPIPGLATVIALDNPQGAECGRINGLDLAQASRFATVVLDRNDSPWREALAGKYEHIDLSDLFVSYNRLSREVTNRLSPRVLDHLIWMLTNGFPAIWTLPKIAGERLTLGSGVAETERILSDLAEALDAPNPEPSDALIDRLIQAAVRDGVNISLEGPPGIGKTARIKAALSEMTSESVYFSGPATNPEDLTVPFPAMGKDGKTYLEMMPHRKLMTPTDKVVVIDEERRANRRTANAFMEVVQEGSVGGVPIPGYRCTIALNNPKEVAGYKMDVGRADLAQVTRYAGHVDVSPNALGATAWLYDTYGEDALPFVEWWKNDIDATARVLVPPRSVEKLINLHQAGLPLEWGKPHLDGEYVPVPLVALQARLAGNRQENFSTVIDNFEEYVERLTPDERHADHDQLAHLAVYNALVLAEQAELESHRDKVVTLVSLLAKQHRMNLVGDKRTQRFFAPVLAAANARQQAAA